MTPPLTAPAVGGVRRLRIIVLALIAIGCAGAPQKQSPQHFSGVETVAMMPVQNMAAVFGPFKRVLNPLSGRVFSTGPVGPDTASSFEVDVYARLSALDRFRVIPPGSALGVLSSLTANEATPSADRALWVETGRRLKADGVMVWFIYRYTDRVGTRLAAEQAASVAFDAYLLRISDGRTLWTRRFDETQRALSENLLEFNKFMSRRGWISAEELTTVGLDGFFESLRAPAALPTGGEIEP